MELTLNDSRLSTDLQKLKARDYARGYRRDNIDKARAAVRKSHHKYRDKHNAYSKSYGEKHRERLNAYQREWRRKNLARYKQTVDKRRAVKRKATIGNTALIVKWQEGWHRKKKVICYWCGKVFHPDKCQTDHVIPLCRGGAHSIENLVISCTKCNFVKNRKSPEVWNSMLSEPLLIL